jgi:hypothetical protein
MEETAMNDFLEFGRDYYPNERPDIIPPLQAGDDPGRRYEADEAALRAIYSPTIADVIVCTHAGLCEAGARSGRRASAGMVDPDRGVFHDGGVLGQVRRAQRYEKGDPGPPNRGPPATGSDLPGGI